MSRRLFVVFSLVAILVMTGCSGQEQSDQKQTDSGQEQTEQNQSGSDSNKLTVSVPSGVLMSQKERITAPESSEIDLGKLVSGNTDFAFDVYRVISSTGDNLFFSPYSISSALSMTYAGARGETEKQMADTLRYRLSQALLHPAFNTLDIQLSQQSDEDENGFKLNIVNAIWGQKDFPFLNSFLDVLAEEYGAGLRITDFAQEPEKSRLAINDWVSQQTADKINDLIPQGVINKATRLVLSNAVYFKAAWQAQFNEDATYDGVFYMDNNDTVKVPMMTKTTSFRYTREDGYQAIELPYEGGEISMVILMPDRGRFDEVERNLDTDMVNGALSNIQSREISLSLPRFEFESGFNLKDALIQLGMVDAFSENADFSGMTGNRDLLISDVVHKAFISVNEEGTEAAAATAVIMALTGLPDNPLELTIDHPFIFLIRDIETGTILFMGRVLNPNS